MLASVVINEDIQAAENLKQLSPFNDLAVLFAYYIHIFLCESPESYAVSIGSLAPTLLLVASEDLL